MKNNQRKDHWEKIYSSKNENEVSWFQPIPETSLNLIKEINIPADGSIIDIGGGESHLVDHLLKLGYRNCSVLDISEAALGKARNRIGDDAASVKWIASDVCEFVPNEKYDLWHDRAAFHFLTSDEEIRKYIDVLSVSVKTNGHAIIGTFSEQGPDKCSGLFTRHYSADSLAAVMPKDFSLVKSFTTDHITPFNTPQNFLFTVFTRL